MKYHTKMTLCKFSFDDYYGVPWDRLEDTRANENAKVGKYWLYDAMERKLCKLD